MQLNVQLESVKRVKPNTAEQLHAMGRQTDEEKAEHLPDPDAAEIVKIRADLGRFTT